MSDNKNNTSRDSSYRFTPSAGAVTNLQELDDGIWQTESIGRNESWTIEGDSLIYIKTSKKRTTRTVYDDLDGDGIFTFSSSSSSKRQKQNKQSGSSGKSDRDSITGRRNDDHHDSSDNDSSHASQQEGYRFTLSSGSVTNLQKYDDGRWKNETADSNESWSFDGTNLIQTEIKRLGSEVSTYSDSDLDGIFTKVSEIFNPNM